MSNIQEFGTYEQALAVLAEAQYRYNALGQVVSTKDPDSLRSMCDREARHRFEQYGDKSKNVVWNGQVIATYTVSATTEEPERREKHIEIPDNAARAWVMEDCPQDFIDAFVEEHAHEIAMRYMEETGELIPHAELVETVIPAKPSMYKNTVLKVKPQAMEKALAYVEPKEIGE